jgi:LacI family transcriptional regulator
MDMNFSPRSGLVNVDIFIGGAPLLETRLCEGLLEFGKSHPQWRFSMRGADFRYTKQWLSKRHVDGVLALIDAKPVARTLDAAGIPWVHLLPGHVVAQPCVNVDDRAIGRLGADFFLEKGFMRCAFCGVGNEWSAQRAAGFGERLAEAGRDCQFAEISFDKSSDWGFSARSEQRLHRWVAGLQRGIAVMAAHDALANRLVDLCLQEGLRVPQDIAVLGVGNHDLLCKLSPVPISSIDAAVPQVAIRGAAMLEALIGGGARPGPTLVSPGPVAERRSTEVTGYGDGLIARVVAHIRDHVCDGLTVEELIKIFPVSHRTLTRRFATYVGHSPAAEIRLARLRQARRMLADTSQSLTNIAAACGYADLPHMNRAFRDVLGTSPGALRRTV